LTQATSTTPQGFAQIIAFAQKRLILHKNYYFLISKAKKKPIKLHKFANISKSHIVVTVVI